MFNHHLRFEHDRSLIAGDFATPDAHSTVDITATSGDLTEAWRQLAAGRIIGGDRDGQLWVGVQNDEDAYDRLSGGLSGEVTHAIIIGDDNAAMALLRIIVETILVEDSVDDLLSGVESMLKEKP